MREASRRNPLNDGPETAHPIPPRDKLRIRRSRGKPLIFFLGGEPAQGWNLQRDACHGRKGTLEATPHQDLARDPQRTASRRHRRLVAGSPGAGTR